MKNISLTILSMSLVISAQAATSWVETPFWKAPRATKFAFSLTPSTDVKDECSFYQKLIYKEDGSLTWITTYKDKMERMRSPEKKLTFLITGAQEKSLKVNTPQGGSDSLPYYTQAEAVTGVDLEDINKIKVKFDSKSYSSLTSKLGMDSGDMSVSKNYQGNYTLTVEYLDVACDLLNGNAQLVTSAPSYVYLTAPEANKIHDFYNERLLPKIYDLFDANQASFAENALKLGVRTGKILEEEFSKMEAAHTEKQLINIYRTLFKTKTLSPASIVKGKAEQRYVIVERAVDAPAVSVIFE